MLLWLVLRGAALLILGDAKCTPMFQNTYVFSHRYAINIQKLDSRRSANPVHPLQISRSFEGVAAAHLGPDLLETPEK